MFEMPKFKIRASACGKIMGNAKKAGELSATCQTYLKEWYSEQRYGDREEISSKYLEKGKYCEDEAISILADLLDVGFLDKVTEEKENEYFKGTCDIAFGDWIFDIKNSWSGKTFADSIETESDDYKYQLQIYMSLYEKKKAGVAYFLLDTPESINYGCEVKYFNDIQERVFIRQYEADEAFIQSVIEKVEKCRLWLAEYHEQFEKQLNRTQKFLQEFKK